MEAIELHESDDRCSEECPLYGHPADPKIETYQATGFQQCTLDQSKQAEKIYNQLEDWEIRILALHPGSRDDGLKGDLHIAVHHADGGVILLEERRWIDYEALSYCWGEPYFESEFQCKAISYPITRNLHAALWHLRQQTEVRYLWIDALCINQYDLDERSTQVARMLSVYQRARQMIVWLGESGSNTGLVSTYARVLDQDDAVRRAKRQEGGHVSHPFEHQYDFSFAGRIDDVKEQLTDRASQPWCKGHAQAFVSGLHDMLTRPWYDRLWVVQEAWAAQDITVACGPYQLKWSILNTLTKKTLESLKTVHSTFRNSLPKFEIVLGDKENLPRPQRGELLHILEQTSTSNCSDPRDHVYAVLRMSNARAEPSSPKPDANKLGIQIDYSKSIKEVYVDVVEFYLRLNGSLAMLVDMFRASARTTGERIVGGRVGGEELPSWCPNWSVPFTLRRGLSARSHGSPRHLRFLDSSVLCLHGQVISRVENVRKVRGQEYPDTPLCFYHYLYELEVDVRLDARLRQGSKFRNAFRWRYWSVSEAWKGDYVVMFEPSTRLFLIRTHERPGYHIMAGLVVTRVEGLHARYLGDYVKKAASERPWEEFKLL